MAMMVLLTALVVLADWPCAGLSANAGKKSRIAQTNIRETKRDKYLFMSVAKREFSHTKDRIKHSLQDYL